MARPFIPVPDVAVFDVLQELDGVPYCNSFHWWIFGDVWNPTNLETLAIALEGWFVSRMLPLLGNDVLYVGVRCRDLTSASGDTFNRVVTPISASYSAPSLPLNDCVYFKTRTSLLSSKHTFYNVISGIPTSEVVGNLVNQPYLNDLFDAYVEFQDVFTWIDTAAVNVSYITGGTYRSEGAKFGIGRNYRPNRKIGNRSKRLRNWIAP